LAILKLIRFDKEELANSLTHGIAVLLSIVGVSFIFIKLTVNAEPELSKWISAGIYSTALIILYSASTVYHIVQHKKLKHIFRIADHSAIYIKIAGTYTPFLILALPHFYGYEVLIVMWGLTGIGIVFKIFFVHRFNILSTIVYLAMGWVAVFLMKPLYLAVSLDIFIYILAGGACFTIGVIFYLFHRLPYSHSIWHLFVMGGSAMHFISIYLLFFSTP
jgi:hemolysin III